MSLQPIATVDFVDRETADDGFAIVRASKDVVALTISLRANGDIEVFLGAADCQSLAEALFSASAIGRTHHEVKQTAADGITTLSWYATHLIFEAWIDVELEADPLCEDQVVLFRARDEGTAREFATRYGKAEQASYRNDRGQVVEWKFARCEAVEEAGPKPDNWGWEVASRFFRPSDAKTAQQAEEGRTQREQ